MYNNTMALTFLVALFFVLHLCQSEHPSVLNSKDSNDVTETTDESDSVIELENSNVATDVTHQNYSIIELETLQKEFADYFDLESYNKMDHLDFAQILNSLEIEETRKLFPTDYTICNLCKIIMSRLKNNSITVEIIGTVICNIYIALSTLTVTNFCKDIIQLNKPILEYIIDHSKIFEPEYACSIFLQNKKCYYRSPALTWAIQIPEGPAMIPHVTKQPYKRTLEILHLSDVHISFDYEVNGISNCGYPVCCKKDLGNPLKGQNAGYWGDYMCDIPQWLYINTLAEIKSRHKNLDFIYFTGDIIDHTAWKGSREENIEMMKYTFDVLEEYFPNKTILPILGNHEAFPLNVFAPPQITDDKLSQKWLYNLIAQLWSPWLPSNTMETIKKQGYYSYYVYNNLKVIALNNNICYFLNWWVLHDTIFLNEQLTFLRRELELAEQNGHFVHILAHVPPGNKECIEPWEQNYNSLIARYSHIIKGQFFGHTHTDELKVFYNNKREPINVGYNGASLTTFLKYNPNYKILKLDPNTYDVVDIDTYIFNLTEANLIPNAFPKWFKLYSMKNAYGLDKLSPKTFDNLAEKMMTNASLFYQYWRYKFNRRETSFLSKLFRFYTREGDESIKEGCDNNCTKELICKITTTNSLEPHKEECK